MEYVYNLHKVMQEKNTLLIYNGEFSQDITKAVLAMTERNLDTFQEESAIKRKVFKVMVECLQNVVKHSEESNMEEKFTNSIFAIAKTNEYYDIITGNSIFNDSIDTVKAKIEQVNALDADGLKKLYKEVIKNGSISDKGGAGLGFIDMARKSGQKLEYSFHKIDDKHSFFVLVAKISRTTSK